MAEAQSKFATLNDVLEDDFIRFCQFAYTGDYSTPAYVVQEISSDEESVQEPYPVAAEDSLPQTPPPEEDDGWGVSPKKKNKKASSPISKKATLRRSFENKSFCTILPRDAFLDSCRILANSEATQDYTPVFLAHARLYVLADKYGVKPLQTLSLYKLHKTLVDFTLYKARIGDVIQLARYTYSDEHTLDNGSDQLRKLVSKYLACESDVIGGSKEFLSLMEEGGPFVRDFWALVHKKLL